MKKQVSMSVINRLPRYYRYLGELVASGVNRISSKELSEKMNITASQIRQDLNCFGGFGQQGYGYNVQNLYEEIGKILGLNNEKTAILVEGWEIWVAPLFLTRILKSEVSDLSGLLT